MSQFSVQRVYLKALSFEVPGAPDIFFSGGRLHSDLNINVSSTAVGPGVNEVVLRLTVTAKDGDKVFYRMELRQGGLFQLAADSSEQRTLNVDCAGFLYPFAIAAAADAAQRASLPAPVMPLIDWAQLYAESIGSDSSGGEAPLATASVH